MSPPVNTTSLSRAAHLLPNTTPRATLTTVQASKRKRRGLVFCDKLLAGGRAEFYKRSQTCISANALSALVHPSVCAWYKFRAGNRVHHSSAPLVQGPVAATHFPASRTKLISLDVSCRVKQIGHRDKAASGYQNILWALGVLIP